MWYIRATIGSYVFQLFHLEMGMKTYLLRGMDSFQVSGDTQQNYHHEIKMIIQKYWMFTLQADLAWYLKE